MNGILLVDKEQDWTSNDVVAKLKGVLHERRIGHSGTLDPMATGLLVLFVGRATRAVEFAESQIPQMYGIFLLESWYSQCRPYGNSRTWIFRQSRFLRRNRNDRQNSCLSWICRNFWQ